MPEEMTNHTDLQMAFDVSHSIRLTCGQNLTRYGISNPQ